MILGSFRYLEKNDLEKIIILFRLESHSCDESLSELAMVGNLIFLKHYEPQGGAGPGVRGGFVHFTMFKVELATMFEFEVVVLDSTFAAFFINIHERISCSSRLCGSFEK